MSADLSAIDDRELGTHARDACQKAAGSGSPPSVTIGHMAPLNATPNEETYVSQKSFKNFDAKVIMAIEWFMKGN